MMRLAEIATGLALTSALLLSSPAQSNERPLYMDSVLYTGDTAEAISFLDGANDALIAAAADSMLVGADGDSSATPDTLALSEATPEVPRLRQPHVAVPITSGAAGGFLLGVGAAYLGAVIADQTDDSNELAALGGAIAGFAIGEPLGVALGTHWGNGSRGSFGADFAVALVTGLVGIAIAVPLQAPGAVVGAALQLGATAWVERRTAQKNYEDYARTTSR